ncbi:MAG: alpha-hydroxy-acid oxidizing protein [Myxococcales bacterium]|nr:alpha-hydroxy-acid oxidizing protein [Myxococcales bacterium]
MANDAKRKGRKLLTVRDFERLARQRLSKPAYDYFRSGSEEERALARNEEAYRRWVVWYRVLVDVAERDLSTTVLGIPVATPILIAPTAYHRLAHPEGELATARAATVAGTVYVVSTLATTALEDVAQESAGPKFFQLYVHKDRGFTRELIERAESAGYDALVVTADTPLLGRRLRDERNGFCLPDGLVMSNLAHLAGPTDGSMLARYVAERHDASFTWKDLEWLKSLSHLPIVLKGIVRVDDAVRAADEGVAGVIVSNHGGRQLDSAPATLDALPGIAEALRGRCEVLMDGGIRSGADVFKALALGARAVLVGRPVLWGLAAGGEDGVVSVLRLLAEDLSKTMALAGTRTLADIERTMVALG